MTVSMDDLLDPRRHLNTLHSCVCVRSDPTPATVARTSSVSHLRQSSTVFRHASMLILSAQSCHVELAFCHFLQTLSPLQRLCAPPSHLLALVSFRLDLGYLRVSRMSSLCRRKHRIDLRTSLHSNRLVNVLRCVELRRMLLSCRRCVAGWTWIFHSIQNHWSHMSRVRIDRPLKAFSERCRVAMKLPSTLSCLASRRTCGS